MRYVDQTITLGSANNPTNFQYTFPHDQKVWVGISNESQSALTVHIDSEKSGVPDVNIDPGQPLVSQMSFYQITVNGPSGAIFNIKIQDSPLQIGKSQISSETRIPVSTNVPNNPVSALPYAIQPPPGTMWTLIRARLTLLTGSGAGMRDLKLIDSGGVAPRGTILVDTGNVSVANSQYPAYGGPSANAYDETAGFQAPVCQEWPYEPHIVNSGSSVQTLYLVAENPVIAGDQFTATIDVIQEPL
jgi:hypothetical protein